jgi:hypothetical protein
MMSRHPLSILVRRLGRRVRRAFADRVRIRVDDPSLAVSDNQDPEQKFSTAWFERLYAKLGDGITCFRPKDEEGYSGGMLDACSCCKPNTRLHLFPNEESGFVDQINDTDFKLVDHPIFEDRKSIICSKLGHCDGRKPYTCRTHPVYYVNGLMLYEEALCRLGASLFLKIHKDSVDRIRSVVYEFELEDVPLGYGHGFRMKDGELYREFEH